MQEVAKGEIRELISSVDYTETLSVTASSQAVREACRTALRYGFRAVVAFPCHLQTMVEELVGSSVYAQIPVGFPSGCVTTLVKCREVEEGLRNGATDIDMVMNISAFKEGDLRRVRQDIEEVMRVARPSGAPFKVIIEVTVLTEAEKVEAAKLVKDTGADFIKTSTGFFSGRVTLHDVALIRRVVGAHPAIKASGGVPSLEDGVAFMRAGARVVAMRHRLVEQLEELGWPETDRSAVAAEAAEPPLAAASGPGNGNDEARP